MFLCLPLSQKPRIAGKAQREAGVGGETTTICGTKYLILHAKVEHACANLDLVSRETTLKIFKEQYSVNEGFTVHFLGATAPGRTLTLSWKCIVDLAERLLVFGPPLDGNQ